MRNNAARLMPTHIFGDESTMTWNPDLYLKFQSERFAPFDDLMALVDKRENLRVVDLGCGTGELTRRLADELPNSDTLGIDNSAEMLDKAQAQARPGLKFELGDIETGSRQSLGEWDLVFSHAAIQWVENHETLVPQLLKMVRIGGQLAVQLPSNHNHLTHVALREIAQEEPFKTALNGWYRLSPVLTIEQYGELLYENGGRNLTVIEKMYPHVMESVDGMIDWVSGTALLPYKAKLPADLFPAFMERYRARLLERWPNSPVFYGFRRILFAATREV
jgi:trans-aconitate 2-methyltransferase